MLSAEARELRRKVILARVVAAVVLLLIVMGVVLTQWLGSETGTVSKTEFSLKNDKSNRNVLECLDTAERLSRQGKRESAQKIELAAEHALKIAPSDVRQSAKDYLELAADLHKRGDNQSSFDFAYKALKGVQDYVRKGTAQKGKDLFPSLTDSVDQACGLMLDSKVAATADQIKVATDLASQKMEFLEYHSRGRIFDLCLSTLGKNALPTSENLLNCLLARDIILAQRAPLAELDKTLSKAADAVDKFQGSKTLKKSPEPCLLTHYCDIAYIVFNRDPASSRKYLKMADDILQQLDIAKETASNPATLAYCCNKMSIVYSGIGESKKALACAKAAVACRPVQDLDSAACVSQLANALFLSGSTRDAEAKCKIAFSFYQSQDPKSAASLKLESECALQFYAIMLKQGKTTMASSMITSEIKEQNKHLPSTALNVAELEGNLAKHLIAQANTKAAAEHVQRVVDLRKQLHGDDRVEIDTMLVRFAIGIKDPKMLSDAIADELSSLKSDKPREFKQEWLDGLVASLSTLKKSEDKSLFNQSQMQIQDAFTRLLSSGRSDPSYLARVINDLGSNGEEKLADVLRSQATDKLPQDKASAFLSRCMDFVVGDGSDGARYADPEHAIKVYLDLAHNMQGKKDGESVFKYGFEALKIVHALVARKPELKAQLLDSTDDAAGAMLKSKQKVSVDQWKIIYELASLMIDNVKKGGKGQIIDLALQTRPNSNAPISADLLQCMLVRDESLAAHGDLAALDTQVSQTTSAFSGAQPTDLTLPEHMLHLSELLYLHRDLAASHRYLNSTKRLLEAVPVQAASANGGASSSLNKASAGRTGSKQSLPDGSKQGTQSTTGSVPSTGRTAAGKTSSASVTGKSAGAKIATTPAGGGQTSTSTDTAAVTPPKTGLATDTDEAAKPATVNLSKLAQLWSRISILYAKLGDKTSALACARKTVSLRPFQDASGGEAQLLLADRLMDSGAFAEAEPLISAVYKFAKARTQTADISQLRFDCAQRLFRALKELHKEPVAVSTLKDELDSRKQPTPQQALQMMDINKDLASYYLAHDDSKSADDSLNQIKQLRMVLHPEQKAEWGRSGKDADLLSLAVRANDSKLASESAMEMLTNSYLDKGDSLRLPSRWWSIALINFKKTGEQQAYQEVLSFVKQGFKQQLAKPSPDQAVLADVVNTMDQAGEDNLASLMRGEAVRRLPSSAREAFLTKCKNKTTIEGKSAEPEPGKPDDKTGEGKADDTKSDDAKSDDTKSDDSKPDEKTGGQNPQ